MNSIEITLFGGTGLIGGYLKDLIIDDPFFNKINFVTRRVYKSNQKKLVNHVIDFSKYKEISNAIKNSEVVYSAIGTTQSKVNWNKDEYRKIDYDININIAKACKKFQIQNFLISLLPRKTKNTMILFIPVNFGKMDHYLSCEKLITFRYHYFKMAGLFFLH